MICPKCGNNCPDDGNFCDNCGFNFAENPIPSAAPQVQNNGVQEANAPFQGDAPEMLQGGQVQTKIRKPFKLSKPLLIGIGAGALALIAAVIIIILIVNGKKSSGSAEKNNLFNDDLVMVRDTNYDTYFIRSDGNVAFRTQVSESERFHNGMAVARMGSNWGMMDTSGQWVIPPQYDSLGEFHDDLAWFRQNGRYGYINKSNTVVIPAQFDSASDFYDGLAYVKDLNTDKYGYIDTSGNFVVAPTLSKAYPFINGHAKVGRYDNGYLHYGLIDKSGNETVSVMYKSIEYPTDPKTADYNVYYKNNIVPFNDNDAWGFMDLNGNNSVVVAPQFSSIGTNYSRDYTSNNYIPVSNGSSWGYYNLDSKSMAIDYLYYSAGFFYNGKAIVDSSMGYSFITPEMTMIDPNAKAYSSLDLCYDTGYAIFCDKDSYNYGIVETSSGKEIVSALYGRSDISSMTNGMVAFRDSASSLWGYMDVNGNVVVAPSYQYVSPFFDDGYAVVENTTGDYNIIDKSGNPVNKLPLSRVYY